LDHLFTDREVKTMPEALKFSRTKPSEAQFRKILAAEPKGISEELAQAAMALLREREFELRCQNTKQDFVVRFERLAQLCPSAMLIVINASKLAKSGTSTVDADEVADEYVGEDA
jgi:hypothetical protein